MENYSRKTYIQSFDSILAIANYIDENIDSLKSGGLHTRLDSALTFKQAMKIARNGGDFPEGAKDIKPAQLNLSDFDMHLIKLPQPVNSVVGHRPDVAAYMANSPMSMIKFTQHDQPNRLIKIFVNVCKTWDIQAETSLNRGNAILSVINALEAEGYSTEIWAGMRAGSDGYTTSYDVCIKSSTAHYSLDSIAYAIANDGFLRRVLFAAAELSIKLANHNLTKAIHHLANNSWGYDSGLTYPDYDLAFGYLSENSGRWTTSNSLQKVIDITKDQLSSKLGNAA